MNIRETNRVVADNIQRIIKEKGLKKKAIAQKADITLSEFSDMINGRRIIKVIDIEKIKRSLDVDANELFKSLPNKQTQV